MEKIQKRLIGKEDIAWDLTGTNEQDDYSLGADSLTVSKINASNMPLTAETREKLSAGNVDTALKNMHKKINSFAAADAMTEDVVVEFSAQDTQEVIQQKINLQKKNLNGHTLTFKFPRSLEQILTSTIVFQDFCNGAVYVTGGEENNLIPIYDQFNITSLFKVYRCQCEFVVEYFYFTHSYSTYAVSVESSASVIFRYCVFAGASGKTTYAVKLFASSGEMIDCGFVNDAAWDSMVANSYLSLSGGQMSGDIYYFSDSARFIISGGTKWKTSPHIVLNGKNSELNPGAFEIKACDGTTDPISFIGKPDGVLTWKGKNVETVESSGSNYIRYTSGLQICWGQAEGSTRVTLPQPFVSVEYQVSLTDVGVDRHSGGAGQRKTTTFYIYGPGGVFYHWIAIGKWK